MPSFAFPLVQHAAAVASGICLGIGIVATCITTGYDYDEIPAGYWWMIVGLVVLGGLGFSWFTIWIEISREAVALWGLIGFSMLDVALWQFVTSVREDRFNEWRDG